MSMTNYAALDTLKGVVLGFHGANKGERVFRVTNDEGNDWLFKVEGDKRTITSIATLPADTPPPRGCGREEAMAQVIVYSYDKQDNFRHAVTPGTEFHAAQWNRGFLLMDTTTGHVWLRIGINNYRQPAKARAIFEYAFAEQDDDDEEGETAE